MRIKIGGRLSYQIYTRYSKYYPWQRIGKSFKTKKEAQNYVNKQKRVKAYNLLFEYKIKKE